MTIKLMLFSILFSLGALADSVEKVLNDYDPKVDIIADNYEAGPFLIYDCEENHWTCVLEEYYKDCDKRRQDSIHKKSEILSCAPIAALPNKKSCFQQQLFMVSRNMGKRFCIGSEWKQKEMEF